MTQARDRSAGHFRSELSKPSLARRHFAGLLLAAALAISLGASAAAQQIMFEPRLPRAPHTHIQGDPDWNTFFRLESPWQRAASRIAELILTTGYINDASDDDLRAVAVGLTARAVAITVVLQPVAVAPDEACGKTEGYDDPRQVAFAAAKLKRLGIAPKYLLLDGPLWFGHYASGAKECRFSIEETARRTAENVGFFLAQFPDLTVGDIEGTPLVLQPDWQRGYGAFKTALDTAMGRRLDSLTLDVNWRAESWPKDVTAMAAMTRSLGMRFGMIYNGDGLDDSNAGWIAHAERNYTVLETEHGLVPDIAVFSSWNKYPTHALPETSPDTMTSLINRYRLPRTRFEARRERQGWRARLVDGAGQGLAGETVTIARLGLDPDAPPPVRTVSGIVPSDAVGAILGWRVNTECRCAGDNDLLLGELSYAETEGGAASHALKLADLVGKPRADAVELAAAPGVGATRLRVHHNSGRFPVTPGARYELRAPIGALNSEGLSGNATIIWLDRDGKGLSRTNIFDNGDRIPAGELVTDRDGGLAVPASRQPQELSFAGTAALRAALARIEPAAE